jgi:deoxyribose-phosphate aldolase
MGVIVRVGKSAGVSVSVGDDVNVGCETVADADSVRDASGVGCTDWVNAAKVEAALVLTTSAGDPVGFPLSGKLQAHKTDTDRIVEIMANRLFIESLL